MRRGFDIHVLGRAERGPKPDIVRAIGATYHIGDVSEAGAGSDIVVDCAGAPNVIAAALHVTRPSGIVCLLAGLSASGHEHRVDVGALNQTLSSRTTSSSAQSTQTALTTRAPRASWAPAVGASSIGSSRRAKLDGWKEALESTEHELKAIIVAE